MVAADAAAHEMAELHRLATLGMLSATVAHEVNNCLTPALSFIQLALRARETAPVRDDLRRALSCIERAASISSAVLTQATDAGGSREACVAKALEEAIDCLARHPEKDGIRLNASIPADLSVGLRSDALRQILLNLILNSQRALAGRGGTITIHAGRSTWNNTQARIVIEDDGPGVPASIINDLFKPFVTAPTSDTAQEPGSGLGLAVTRSLLEAVGGSITLDRQHRGGARFMITLPVANGSQGSAAA